LSPFSRNNGNVTITLTSFCLLLLHIMKIVILGGSGLIGTKLQPLLRSGGHEVAAVSTRTGVNVLTGDGLSNALQGADVVIDVLNTPTFEPVAVLKFYSTANAHLLPAEKEAGVQHHVILSVVGCDRSSQGYLKAKAAQERAVMASGLPYTVVRATQFFEFIGFIAAADGDSIRLSSVMMQPIAADDVAQQIARAAVSSPLNGVVDIAGPEKRRLDGLARTHYQAMNITRTVITDESTGYFGDPVDDQSLVPLGDAVLGTITYKKWLAVAKANA